MGLRRGFAEGTSVHPRGNDRVRYFPPPLPNGDFLVIVPIAPGNIPELVKDRWPENSIRLFVSNENVSLGRVEVLFKEAALDVALFRPGRPEGIRRIFPPVKMV